MDRQSIKILVADDDPFVREMLSDILQSEGHFAITAENGEEAFAKYCETQDIKLIISDMNMPKMSGTELISKLRDEKKEVPVIILTGSSDISTAIEALKNGANDYIIKDENIQDAILISAKNVLEKQEIKEQNARLIAELEERNKQMEYELNIAHKMQLSIVPQAERIEFFSRISFLEISSVFKPCNSLGGDLWDIKKLGEDKIGILVIDFAGHGIAPSLNTFRIKEFFHNLADNGNTPAYLVGKMNANIFKNYNMHATCFYAIYDRKNKKLSYCRAGHPYGIVYKKKEGKLVELNSKGMALGFFPDSKYQEMEIVLETGDKLFFYTDGIIEARNKNNEFFGEDNFKSTILKHSGKPCSEIANLIMNSLLEFTGDVELDDDVTLVALEPQ